MPKFNTSHIGCLDSLQLLISGLFKYGYPSNISCNNVCDICKNKCMAIKLITLGYVNNYGKNRYLAKFSKAAVQVHFVLVMIDFRFMRW